MDFYIPSLRISIEIDGDYHNDIKQIMMDRQRDQHCARLGILVLRYSNEFAKYPTLPQLEELCMVLGRHLTDESKSLCIAEGDLAQMYKNKYTKEYFQNIITQSKK